MLYHSQVADVLLQDGRVDAVIVGNKAGRCHSATSEALASSRVTDTAMGMGQAAGTAAGLAVASGVSLREIDVSELQGRLLDAGAILEAPDSTVVPGDPAW